MKYVIVGGTSGIGLAAAKAAVASGHEVVTASRDPGKFSNAQAIGALPVTLDASNLVQCQAVFSELGPFDHLVVCASGASGAGNFRDLDLADLRKGFEGKFWPQVNCAKACLPAISGTGSITFIGAISSRAMQPGTAGLAAINAALEAMIPVLASELRPLRVNAVVPGVVDTPWWSRLPVQEKTKLFEQLATKVPVGRVGTPDDLAQAIMFVTTNTFITGTVIDCDGGWKLKGA
ncbi:SDR family oxidoreductase [Xanthomonas massiliensis]|uniref:SDR family oxidoreductase n=1 Tax=Xanthomonas massiliensis TaxID=1720302 RepID=UPI0008260C03|nr:SDR family oxidoreductase [Xanthomonas massiliensis]